VVENVKKDYLKIQYSDGDYLYVPTNQLDLIQKYIGSEGKTRSLANWRNGLGKDKSQDKGIIKGAGSGAY